jgi:glutaredoxin 3
VGRAKASSCHAVNDIVIYTTRWCPFCIRAKALLDRKGVVYQEIAVDGDSAARQEMTEAAGQTSVPQIWIGGQHIGGCDELYGLERSGGLDPMLASKRA